FFDNIDHELMLKAIDQQNPPKLVRLALVRWLKADVMYPDGSIESGESGTPQGGVISPLLANLFLHYTFDKWMEREFPTLPFERYADDAIIHCVSEKQAQYVLSKLKRRIIDCKLELHPEKTKIVNCEVNTNKQVTNNKFDFLGFTFRRRGASSTKSNTVFTSFLPAVGDKKKVVIKQKIKSFNWQAMLQKGLDNVAKVINPYIRGIINDYSKFYQSELDEIWKTIDARLVRWIMKKHKRYKGKKTKSFNLLEEIKSSVRYRGLFAHWQFKLSTKAKTT
ncbi:reverse transcriptase domain-containing protein, partial [Thorsellia kenyensis]